MLHFQKGGSTFGIEILRGGWRMLDYEKWREKEMEFQTKSLKLAFKGDKQTNNSKRGLGMGLQKTLFFSHFFLFFRQKFTKNIKNQRIRLITAKNKYFDQLSGARSSRKLVQIHNRSKFERENS